MSLIDEALKRARLDAARQDAARQAGAAGAGGAGGPRGGFASPWTHMERSRGHRAGPRRVVVAAAVALSLLVGVVGSVLFLRSSSGTGATAAATVAATAATARPDPAAAVRPEPTSVPMAMERGTAAAPVTRENAGSMPPRQEPAPAALAASPVSRGTAAFSASPGTFGSAEAVPNRARPATSPAAAPSVPPAPTVVDDDDDAETPPTPSPVRSSAAAGTATVAGAAGTAAAAPTRPGPAASAAAAASIRTMADGGTYVGEVKLADGSPVKLSGIAWSDASPVAMINGKLVGPGQGVDQVTVDRIERDRVTLRHRSGALFYLRLN